VDFQTQNFNWSFLNDETNPQLPNYIRSRTSSQGQQRALALFDEADSRFENSKSYSRSLVSYLFENTGRGEIPTDFEILDRIQALEYAKECLGSGFKSMKFARELVDRAKYIGGIVPTLSEHSFALEQFTTPENLPTYHVRYLQLLSADKTIGLSKTGSAVLWARSLPANYLLQDSVKDRSTDSKSKISVPQMFLGMVTIGALGGMAYLATHVQKTKNIQICNSNFRALVSSEAARELRMERESLQDSALNLKTTNRNVAEPHAQRLLDPFWIDIE
jgi:hypothetical protein